MSDLPDTAYSATEYAREMFPGKQVSGWASEKGCHIAIRIDGHIHEGIGPSWIEAIGCAAMDVQKNGNKKTLCSNDDAVTTTRAPK